MGFLDETFSFIGDSISNVVEGAAGAVVDAVEGVGSVIGAAGDALFLGGDSEEQALGRGDIIGVCRGCYDHYGVYVNKNCVIHYTSIESDIGDNVIMKTTFRKFLRDSSEYFILNFSETCNGSCRDKIISVGGFVHQHDYDWNMKWKKCVLYSPEETVKRAKSRLGEDKYSLLFNNCEHFAIWCKTGVEKSYQVDNVKKILMPDVRTY